MALSLGKFVLTRVATVVIVVVGVTGADLAGGQRAAPRPARGRRPDHLRRRLADYLENAFLHFEFGRSRGSGREVADVDPPGAARRPQRADRRHRARPRARHRGRRLLRGAPAHVRRPRARERRGAVHDRAGLRRRADAPAAVRQRARDGRVARARPHRLRPVRGEPAALGGLARGAVARARPPARGRLAADDARLDGRGARRGLPAHGDGEGAAPRAPSCGATRCRARSRRCSRSPPSRCRSWSRTSC